MAVEVANAYRVLLSAMSDEALDDARDAAIADENQKKAAQDEHHHSEQAEADARRPFNLTSANADQDRRIAGARRDKPAPTLDDVKAVLARMPCGSPVEKRDRAVIAFAILSGARDGAIASFRLKHVDFAARTIFQDGRDVKTKGRKTFTSSFFPVGPEPLAIVADYLRMLTQELGFGPDEPLFPSTVMGQDADRNFVAQGLTRKPWSRAQPICRIFANAFAAAGLPACNPHLLRKTLALDADTLNLTREEEKAWSQNCGHESVWTTRESYGTLPGHRQTVIMRRLAELGTGQRPESDIAAMQAALDRLKASRAA